MQEQNLPTPVTDSTPESSTPEMDMSLTGEVINTPVAPSPERASPAGDRVNQGAPVQQSMPVNLPQPTVQSISTTDEPIMNNAAVLSHSNPAVADDVDVIEKVWVQKAKAIVEQTKTDPYRQEEEVGKLQTDYQMKRFGEPATSE